MDAAANEIERLRSDLQMANDQYSSMTHERDQLANAMREILNMNAGEGGDSYAMQEFVRETLSDT